MKPKNPTESTKRPQASTILECPSCYSHRTAILNTRPIRARCVDCDTTYAIHTDDVEVSSDTPAPPPESSKAEELKTKNRKTKADYRAEIDPVAPPNPSFNLEVIEEAIASGPAGIRAAQRTAMRVAKQYMEDACDQWRKETDYLRDSTNRSDSARASARYARVWRPRFLAALSMLRSPILAARHARVCKFTIYQHRKLDPEFAAQWQEAEEHAIELLHAQVFRRGLEGDLEPLLYMGVPVGWVRKFDSKLQIELLRAYKPDRFKTAGVNVNLGVKGDVFVLTEEQRHKLIEINREFLLDPTTLLTNGDDLEQK
jgi:hypothetical protein